MGHALADRVVATCTGPIPTAMQDELIALAISALEQAAADLISAGKAKRRAFVVSGLRAHATHLRDLATRAEAAAMLRALDPETSTRQ